MLGGVLCSDSYLSSPAKFRPIHLGGLFGAELTLRGYGRGMEAPKPWLVAAAAPKEVRALIDGLDPRRAPPNPVPDVWCPVEIGAGDKRVELLRTGVGKTAAGGAIGRWFDPARHAGVLNIGIAGALPGAWLDPGSVVLADPSVMTDEGVLTPKGFITLGEMGFGADAEPIRPDDLSRAALTGLVDLVGPVATVSVCSGTDAWAGETARRAGLGQSPGLCEAMEGAAVGLAARRIDPSARFAELRVISNSTGDRERQSWDLDLALGRLSALIAPAVRALGAKV